MPFWSIRKKSSGSNSRSVSGANNGDGTASAGVRVNQGPGAVSVGGADSAVFRVQVPNNVQPGEEFQVHANGRIVRVRCPPDSRAGQYLQITVPVDPNEQRSNTNLNSNNSSSSLNNDQDDEATLPDSPGVTLIDGSNPPAYTVMIPKNTQGGQQFPVTIAGHQLMVTCPTNARPGMSVRIVPPVTSPPARDLTRRPAPRTQKPKKSPAGETQMFEVVVPAGVKSGQPFALLAGGVRVLVTCPSNATAGQKIRFHLPMGIAGATSDASDLAKFKITYDKDGWMRTIRVTDMKFQWIRMDDNGDIDLNKRFHIDRSAYVRKLDFLTEGYDPRMRGGRLCLVPASEAVVDSKIKSIDGRELVTYSDIASAQVKTFEDKVDWFQETCADLCVEWNEGHMRMNVRREFLLSDSMEAVMCLSRNDLRKVWRFEFIGEEGIDAGGLAREWFQLVTEEIFDPDMGLWQSSETNQMSMQINPASELSCPDDHLNYYRFLGRVMGKALFDRQLVAGHMVKYIYKHLLGWPITFGDLEAVDEEYYNNLKQLTSMDDVEMMCLDFSTTEETLGERKTIDLVPNGSEIYLDNNNLPEYLEACLKYKLLGRVKKQINQLLLGFFDVIPEPLLTVFDYQEMELLMCGLPVIDMIDWMEQTEYSGSFEQVGPSHHVVEWFWEVVDEFDQELKARLLQFVTGTSGVPARGFGVLQGNDGNIRRFTIHGVDLGVCLYPRSHTCFNRIDLPIYDSIEDLKERLTLAVTMVATGFDLE
eukprot:CAMPEP_0197835122 /NCGR_PEP_ID=MMETSP1437-20131217/24804_1 /TAXON_ID=49252 ORGANISM="Eucampia antarctica, Strain CCMP1452" /NCGR_SAMPLE_ID=MMETSP1437 /ASSEMBLY_ACC=CAM_ASM_001096 /LENGTH=758 /DNA_ID=CAMNT_0043440319 /DNA_START=49 /DNA_END=2325 /DNA_ORIENTATION=+